MKLVLLSGMDGTGLLYQPLLCELPLNVQAQVVTYSVERTQTYSELLESIKEQLPKTPFFLLAESFSGVLAHSLSLDATIPMKKLVLVASFLSSPHPKISWLAKILPLSMFVSRYTPQILMRFFCFGPSSSDNLIALLRKCIILVDAKVITHRLRMLLDLRQPKIVSPVDCLIINPAHDRLIPRRISSLVKDGFRTCEVVEVEGPHFLAQTSPRKIADLILGDNTPNAISRAGTQNASLLLS